MEMNRKGVMPHINRSECFGLWIKYFTKCLLKNPNLLRHFPARRLQFYTERTIGTEYRSKRNSKAYFRYASGAKTRPDSGLGNPTFARLPVQITKIAFKVIRNAYLHRNPELIIRLYLHYTGLDHKSRQVSENSLMTKIKPSPPI